MCAMARLFFGVTFFQRNSLFCHYIFNDGWTLGNNLSSTRWFSSFRLDLGWDVSFDDVRILYLVWKIFSRGPFATHFYCPIESGDISVVELMVPRYGVNTGETKWLHLTRPLILMLKQFSCEIVFDWVSSRDLGSTDNMTYSQTSPTIWPINCPPLSDRKLIAIVGSSSELICLSFCSSFFHSLSLLVLDDLCPSTVSTNVVSISLQKRKIHEEYLSRLVMVHGNCDFVQCECYLIALTCNIHNTRSILRLNLNNTCSVVEHDSFHWCMHDMFVLHESWVVGTWLFVLGTCRTRYRESTQKSPCENCVDQKPRKSLLLSLWCYRITRKKHKRCDNNNNEDEDPSWFYWFLYVSYDTKD